MPPDAPQPAGDDSGSPDVVPDAPDDFSGLEAPSAEDLGSQSFDSTPEPSGGVPPPPQPAASASPAPAPSAPPPAATPPQGTQAQPAAETPPASPAPGQGEQAAQADLDSYNPADLITALDAGAADYVAHVAQQYFQLTPEDLAEMESNPETFFPKAAGRIAFVAAKQTLAHIGRLVPRMIEDGMRTSQERTTKRDEAKNLFRAQWPQIPDTAEANGLIGQFARVYRQSNPEAKLQDVVANVGRAVAAYMGLSGTAAAAPAATGASAPAPARPVAFTPAPAGVEIKAPVESSPWDGMFRDYD